MTRIKKLLIAFFLLFLLGTFAVFFFNKKSVEQKPQALPTPNIPKSVEGGYEIEFLVPEGEFNLPQKTTIDTKKAVSLAENEVGGIASRLGLTEGPVVANDATEGRVFIYRNENAALVAYLEKGKVMYTLNGLPRGEAKDLSEEEIGNIAKQFLVENGFVESAGIKFSSLVFLKTEGSEAASVVGKEEATVYQVNFVPAGATLPLLAPDARRAPIYVQVLPSGTVFASSFQKMSVVRGSTEYNLKNYPEVLSDIASATLVSLDEGNIHLPDLPKGAVKKVSITKVALVSLFDPERETLLPVFFLEGTADATGLGPKIKAALYLPSIKAP